MNNRKSLPLKYPDNFMVSVVITNLDAEMVLQQFIDEFSFYDFYSPQIGTDNDFVSTGIIDLIEQYYHWYSPLTTPAYRGLSSAYLKRIHCLKNDKCLTDAERSSKSKLLMKEWKKELPSLIRIPGRIKLEQNNCVKISFEFNLMCALCHMKPERALTQFMDEISIANIQAYHQFDPYISYRKRPYIAENSLPEDKREIREVYEKKFTALHTRMSKVKSFDQRVAAYQAFYKQWCDELLSN
ncbi:hypothetical protein ACSBL2_25145 [Pedobacter sp. AW31-3R]|uniref:hypothetical protein n=1 Tax=Pedobacter sp. AW31-3R TaxID=3445781 RepID=UPI003FA0D01F